VAFQSGAQVRAHQVLIEMNDEAERASLRSLEAAQALARLTLQRDRQLLSIQAVTAAQVETDEADLQSRTAQVDAQRALIDKKTLVAPFDGRLGITTVAPGQYVNPGDKLANLQEVDRLVVDFSIPQNQADLARMNGAVDLRVDTFPGQVFHGVVSARNATVDAATRNLQIEATVANSRHRLLPGMFAHVNLIANGTMRYQTLPQSAVAFNPYGAVVYLVKEVPGKDGKPAFTAQQTIVTTGPTRGDQVAILSGVPEGARVVTSGQLKLRNGTPVVIDNTVMPSADPDPHPANR
jgi:membrane fusion protein (multidrug efflux system)